MFAPTCRNGSTLTGPNVRNHVARVNSRVEEAVKQTLEDQVTSAIVMILRHSLNYVSANSVLSGKLATGQPVHAVAEADK